VQDCDEREHDNGNGHERLHMCVFPWTRSTPKDGKNQPCPILMILVELPRYAAADLAESWWTRGVDCPAGACLLVEYWPAGGAGITRFSRWTGPAC